ncbi:MAG: DNA-processing protein DprA [Rhodospirillales bacterium]|nr:DNA-processing protein DprA [Rhodospirillales bacterium]
MEGLSVKKFTTAEKLNWIRLIRTPNVGPITFFKLLENFGSIAQAITELPAMTSGKTIPVSLGDAENELEKTERFGARVLTLMEPEYPQALAQIADPPPVITILGHPEQLNQASIAVVGSRNASANGRIFARKIAHDLGERGLSVVSGLARGIDMEAHSGSLNTGTIAVIAGGIDIIYPKENEKLYQAISESGAIVSEMPFGLHPQAKHFPKRNRIISGLSQGTLIVEANPRSGSLITARLALEQGRDVFAVPGWPGDPRSQGGNHLIRQGAILVEKADDVLDNLSNNWENPSSTFELSPVKTKKTVAFTGEQRQKAAPGESGVTASEIEKSLTTAPIAVDELIRQCQSSTADIATALLELELAGRLERHPGNKVSLKRL